MLRAYLSISSLPGSFEDFSDSRSQSWQNLSIVLSSLSSLKLISEFQLSSWIYLCQEHFYQYAAFLDLWRMILTPEVNLEQHNLMVLSSLSSLKMKSEFQLSSLILSMSGTCLSISRLPGSLEVDPDFRSQSDAKSSSDFPSFVKIDAFFQISAL